MDIKAAMAAQQVTARQHMQPGAAAADAPASAAREFEAMYLTQMVDEMLKQVDLGKMGAGQAEQQWRYFLAEAIGKQMAETGGFGLARSLESTIAAYQQSRDGGGT